MNLCIYSVADFCTLHLYTSSVNVKSFGVVFVQRVYMLA